MSRHLFDSDASWLFPIARGRLLDGEKPDSTREGGAEPTSRFELKTSALLRKRWKIAGISEDDMREVTRLCAEAGGSRPRSPSFSDGLTRLRWSAALRLAGTVASWAGARAPADVDSCLNGCANLDKKELDRCRPPTIW